MYWIEKKAENTKVVIVNHTGAGMVKMGKEYVKLRTTKLEKFSAKPTSAVQDCSRDKGKLQYKQFPSK